MKTTPSGTLRVVALVGLGIATVITLRTLAQSPTPTPEPDRFLLTIKTKTNEYHPLKKDNCDGENEFIKLLKNGPYDKSKKMHFKHKDATLPECDLPDGCAQCTPTPSSPGAQRNIKTDKVTVASAAQSVADGDPHVTIQVASKSPADIVKVLDLLAP